MNDSEYLRLSLSLHLFFDRIMMEHSLFLLAAFPSNEERLIQRAKQFHEQFEDLLANAVHLANNNLPLSLLNAGEYVTLNTLQAEQQTSNLLGIPINFPITQATLQLNSGKMNVNEGMMRAVRNLNQVAIQSVSNLINFKEEVLRSVLACSLFTTNYPTLIAHILREAQMFRKLLVSLEERESFNEKDLIEQELFWNTIMMEHAAFIRGLLDPSEDKLMMQANQFVAAYQNILREYKDNPQLLTRASLDETLAIREFKLAGEEGIMNCQIRSIIIPLLADHVLREANHFIRILQENSR